MNTPRSQRLGLERLENRRFLATYMVNTAADPATWDQSDAVVSLREAIVAANGSPGDDTINLPAGDYELANGQLLVRDTSSGTTRIESSAATIDAQHKSRIFRVSAGSALELEGLRLINGNSVSDFQSTSGGAILNFGSIKLNRCAILGSSAGFAGGGISSEAEGTTTVTELTDCVVSDNSAQFRGGGIYVESAAASPRSIAQTR